MLRVQLEMQAAQRKIDLNVKTVKVIIDSAKSERRGPDRLKSSEKEIIKRCGRRLRDLYQELERCKYHINEVTKK